MAKIITVTANTAIDFLIEVDGLAERDNIQAKRSVEFVCGKGINVAKTLESLGFPIVCLGFAGRQSAHLFNDLNSELLHADLISVDGKTRTNITLFDSGQNKEKHIRTSGYGVTHEHCRQLALKIDAYADAGDIIVFSGSLPSGSPNNLYEILISRCNRRSVTTILDADGKALAEGVKARPHLIKPNCRELEELTGKPLPDIQSIAGVAQEIIAMGIERVFVSMGEKGAVSVSRTAALTASVNRPFGKTVTHIGCGDAMVAGLAVSLLEKKDPEEILRHGVACGTANLYSSEPGRLDRDTVSEILRYVEIDKI